MSGQHFKEIVETICLTYKVSKAHLSRIMGVTKVTFNWYERYGVPKSHKPKVMLALRKHVVDLIHKNVV